MDKKVINRFLDEFYCDIDKASTVKDDHIYRDFWELWAALGRCYPEFMADYENYWEGK